ncbi:MAG: hypothetical protein LBC03_00880 [Nitrososphaerota archaeon]|jgi:uncharacterized membrane protein|nr:hypothetical protein [Nitrososphaerota archaeon]
MMDQYRRGWAFRYIREAKAELEAAQKMPYMAPGLLLEAMRKARSAIYYSLGEPAFIELLLRDEITKEPQTDDSILKFLIELESTVEALSHAEEVNSDALMKQADTLVNVATEFVETLTQETYQQ